MQNFIIVASFALLWTGVSRAEFNLTVIHVNDFHAHFEQFDVRGSKCTDSDSAAGNCYGGVARLFTAVQEVRRNYSNVLYLNGGDEYQGTLWFNLFKYEPYVQFLNLLGYDAMVSQLPLPHTLIDPTLNVAKYFSPPTAKKSNRDKSVMAPITIGSPYFQALGNHEFDSEIDGLVPLLNGINFSIVDSNIDISNESRLQGLIVKSKVFSFGSVKIGVIGYTTQRTPNISSPGPNIKFTDEITSVRNEASRLKNQNINIIIAVGHSGFAVDKKIAKEVEDVDIVVGGHTNTFLYTGTPPSIEKPEGEYPVLIRQRNQKQVLVVQDYAFAKYLGFLQVTFDNDGDIVSYGGNPILLNNSYQQNRTILNLMQPYKEKIKKLNKEVVCRSESVLDKDICREQECALGNLMTDGMRHWYKKRPGGDDKFIAIWNSGGIRTPFSIGDILYGDVVATYPFENTVDQFKIQGKYIKQALELSASSHGHGAFLQFSGMLVSYDLSQPAGHRVVKVEVQCQENCTGDQDMEELNENKIYIVAMSNFIQRGGNQYDMFNKYATVYRKQEYLDLDIILEYLRFVQVLKKEDIVDGRITVSGDLKQDANGVAGSIRIPGTYQLLPHMFIVLATLAVPMNNI